MKYYIIDIENPDNKIRHYHSYSRKDFKVFKLNRIAGYGRYSIINDDTPNRTVVGG